MSPRHLDPRRSAGAIRETTGFSGHIRAFPGIFPCEMPVNAGIARAECR
jgi:hypothetical protein